MSGWACGGEYFPCDPMAEYLRPVLRGFRLIGDRAGLELRVEAERLRLYNVATS